MSMVIVPDVLHEAIKRKLDAAIVLWPDAQEDYEHLYSQLLDYYNEHGEIPDFSLTKSNNQRTEGE